MSKPTEFTSRFKDVTGICHYDGDVQIDASYDGDKVAYYTPDEARSIAAALLVAAEEAEAVLAARALKAAEVA
jgi:hypothetical protein